MDEVTAEAERLLSTIQPPTPTQRSNQPLLGQRVLREISMPNGSISAWRSGEGAATLFVHGWNDDHTVWSSMASSFASDGSPCTFMDLPGHGRSPSSQCSYPFAGKAVAKVCADLGPVKAIVAHSFGCIATIRALELGANPDHVVLLAPPIPDLQQGWIKYQRKKGVSEDVLERAAEIYESRVGVPLKPYDVVDAMQSMDVRFLVIGSDGDSVCPVKPIEELNSSVPFSELRLFADLEHRDLVSDDEVISTVHAFLSRSN